MLLLRSALLDAFPHGFTTRDGGVSPAPWDSLNLGGAVGDDPARVAENWRRLEGACGLAFARVRQVHGARVLRADAGTAPVEEADAVLSTSPGVAACVSVADCVPVLLADPATGAVAAVHAGWRGTIARIAAAAVDALAREAGAAPGRLLAAIGPSIGPCCYEVSPDLAARFLAEVGPVATGGARPGGAPSAEPVCSPREDGGLRAAGPGGVGIAAPRLDLWEANRTVLVAAGVRPDRIEVLGRCTSCEREVFFSHRRDAGRTGRQMAFIAPQRPTAGGPLP